MDRGGGRGGGSKEEVRGREEEGGVEEGEEGRISCCRLSTLLGFLVCPVSVTLGHTSQLNQLN